MTKDASKKMIEHNDSRKIIEHETVQTHWYKPVPPPPPPKEENSKKANEQKQTEKK